MIGRLLLVVVALGVAAYAVLPAVAELPDLLARAGFAAVAVLALVHMVPVALCGAAWGRVMPRAGLGLMVATRWVRDGFNEMLAVVPLAGEAVSLRLLAKRGIKPAAAAAGMVADLTAEVAAQLLFSLLGLGLWAMDVAGSQVLHWGVPGLAVAGVAAAGFVAVQHGGGFRLMEGMAARLLPNRRPVAGLHVQLMALYRRPRALAVATGLHLAAWLAACAEAWVGLRLLGHPISVTHAVMLESAVFALRSAAFVVPGALGLQEGGYALLGPLLGIPPAQAVGLSLLKRGRELVLGLPALAAWARLGR
ncbi:MAG TPA: lysylphosphatidylglycerol synthase domain-containing protein [Magnetospirillum sp.]|jgi:putative membrane protein|nr:lysylphosphatidylglycerol synthase domain-containing protein [Magnetospirillum sp.]